MVKFTTTDIDGLSVSRKFDSIGEVLRNWWSSEGTDLPGGDDKVVSIEVEGYPDIQLHLPENLNFSSCIEMLSEIYWNDVWQNKKR